MAYGYGIATATGFDGNGFAERLLESAGVSVVPGFGFGASMKNFVRIGYLSDIGILEEAIERIARFMDSHIVL
jgi:aminotransferase